MLQRSRKTKKKTYIKLMAATVLASTLLLGACGNKKETTQASSSAKTSQSSSSKATSSNKESKTQKSSNSASSEKAKASTDQSSATARSSQAAPAPEQDKAKKCLINRQLVNKLLLRLLQLNKLLKLSLTNQAMILQLTAKLQDKQAEQNKRYKGVLTMVDGDFSAAAGNWKGANGETITVSSGGQFTVESADGKKENYSIKGYSYTLDDGKYNAKIGGGKVIQITTGADGKVSSVALSQ